jgi:hypothetical protein
LKPDGRRRKNEKMSRLPADRPKLAKLLPAMQCGSVETAGDETQPPEEEIAQFLSNLFFFGAYGHGPAAKLCLFVHATRYRMRDTNICGMCI